MVSLRQHRMALEVSCHVIVISMHWDISSHNELYFGMGDYPLEDLLFLILKGYLMNNT